LYLVAAAMAGGIGDALREWPDEAISPVQINRLLQLEAETQACSYVPEPGVSPLNVITEPGALTLGEAPPRALFWWGFGMDAPDSEPPFTVEERAAIPAAPDEAARAARRRHALTAALQPLLLATEAVTLLVLDESPDLLRTQFLHAIGRDAFPVLEEVLLNGQAPGVALHPRTELPFPPRPRWWELAQAVPAPRAVESYSSLASCALRPYEYVLNYPARLSAGSLVSLALDNRLYGNLAHRVMETWFHEHPWPMQPPPREQIRHWLDTRIDALLAAYALPLSASGRRAEKLDFIGKMAFFLSRLLGALHAAGTRAVHIESDHECELADFRLGARIDILASLAEERAAIIDVKWGNQKGREAELAEGRYLQLATYARALAPAPIADVAYMIVKSGALLSRQGAVFGEQAKAVAVTDPALTPAVVWGQFEQTVRWRLEQLRAGRIEVTGTGAEPTEASTPPAEALPVLELESAESGGASRGWGQTFKPVNPHRVLIGAIRE
jgi:hypothetical protein